MTALAVRTGLPGELLANGYVLPPDLTFEEWADALHLADTIVAASPWWLVDLVTYGEDHFGDDHTQALPTADEDPEGTSQARMKQAGWMGRKYPRGTRVPGASYTHHRVVADLPPAERTTLLEEVAVAAARRRPISTRELAKRAEEIERAVEGRAVDAAGAPVADDVLPWLPSLEDLAPDARRSLEARAPSGRLRSSYIEGALYMAYWLGAREAFANWQGE